MALLNILLQIGTLAVTSAVIFEDCGSAYDLDHVDIAGCGMSLPCYLTQGESIPVNVRFYADFSSSELLQDVVININLINLQASAFPEPCQTVHCPVTINAPTSFTSIITVPTNIAVNQRGYLRWRVYNENRRQVLCYAVMVQTQTRLQKILREIATTNPQGDLQKSLPSLNKSNSTDASYLQQIISRHYTPNSR